MLGELRTTSSLAVERQYSPSTKIMACRKFDPVMKEYMDYLMDITARDQTEDMDFTGETTRWWLAKQASTPSAVSIVPPEELGVKTTTNKAVLIAGGCGCPDFADCGGYVYSRPRDIETK